jgi:hypothetical protein
VLGIRAREQWVESAEPRRGLLRELAEGVRYVLSQRYLWPIAACTPTLNLFWNAAFAIYFVFLARELGLEPGVIGLVLALGNVGWLAGALLAHHVTRRLGVGWTLAGAAFLFGPSGALTALAPESSPASVLDRGAGSRGIRRRSLQHHLGDPEAVGHTRSASR